MQHIHALEDANITGPSVVTIGVFDGVHLGHRYLISRLMAHAQAVGLTPIVLTFYPHPQAVLKGVEPGFYLTLPDDKARLLGELGIEWVITQPFDDRVRHIRAADYVDQLLEHLKMRSLWVGKDFALGYKREGTVDFLRDQGQQKGFELRAVDLMDAGDERVSSSRIRALIYAGQVEEAARLLARPHFVRGKVVTGEKRGRTIGFPTANLDVPLELAVPERGVYAGWSVVDGERLPAVTNIGLRPTFDAAVGTTVEAHLLDWSGDLYNREMQLSFTHRLRDEMKFAGVDQLVAQIDRDVEKARHLLEID